MATQAIGLTKTCSKCGEVKPRTPEFFHFCNGYPRPRCRPCWRAWEREHFWKNREARRDSARRTRAKTDRTVRKQKLNAWRAANPEKVKAADARRAEKIKATPELRAKARERVRRHREKLGEEYNRRQRQARARAPEVHRGYVQKHREKNRDAIRLREKIYRAAHPEKVIADAEKRRARMLAAEGEFTGHDIIALIKAHGRVCFYCHTKLKKYQVDHWIPLSRGGTNWPSNLVISCGPCNQRKAAKLPWEWQPHRFKEGQPPRP